MKKQVVDVEAPCGPLPDEPLFAAGAARPPAGPAPVVGAGDDEGPAAGLCLSGAGAPTAASANEEKLLAAEAAVVSAPAPTGHHPRGMSKWPAVLACPCFEGKEGGEDAAEGTRLHALLAGWLEAMRGGDLSPDVDVEALSFHEAGAWRAAQAIRKAVLDLDLPLSELRVEGRVSLYDKANGDFVFGTADCLAVDAGRRTVHVWDFKSFFNPGRDYSAQLLGYGLAAALACKTPIETIRWTVLYGDSKEVDSGEATKAEATAVFHRAMAAFDNAAAHVRSRPTQCAWCELCARFAACPACLETAEAVQKIGDVASVPDAGGARAWSRLPATRKAQLLVIAEFCSKWSDAVRSAAKADLLAGAAIADEANGIAYALRETRGRLRLDVDELWQAAKARGVAKEAFRGCLKPDATEAKKVLRAAGLSARDADAVLEACGARGAGSQTLVRA